MLGLQSLYGNLAQPLNVLTSQNLQRRDLEPQRLPPPVADFYRQQGVYSDCHQGGVDT